MGGGGSKAITTTNVKTKSVVEALAQSIMNCQGNTMVSQRFVISGNYNVVQNTKQVQHFKLSNSCAQSSKNMADIQQSVAAAIKQAASSQSVSVLGALGESRSEVNTNIENEVNQKITQQTVLNIVNNTNAQQELIISGDHNIVNNFEQSQTMDLLYKNCQDVLNDLKSVQSIENKSDQTSTATQSNFISDIVDSIFSGLTSIGIIWMIVVVVAMIVVGYIIINGGPLAALFGSSSTTPATQEQIEQMQKQLREEI